MNKRERKMKHVWMIDEAPADASGAQRTFWTKIGVAFENDDGSLSLHLAAVPVSGKMVVKDPVPPALTTTMKRGAA